MLAVNFFGGEKGVVMRAKELVAIALCYGTGPKDKRLALQQAAESLVAGTGFEPVAFGLSVGFAHPAFL
jgi:hypothetical protein